MHLLWHCGICAACFVAASVPPVAALCRPYPDCRICCGFAPMPMHHGRLLQHHGCLLQHHGRPLQHWGIMAAHWGIVAAQWGIMAAHWGIMVACWGIMACPLCHHGRPLRHHGCLLRPHGHLLQASWPPVAGIAAHYGISLLVAASPVELPIVAWQCKQASSAWKGHFFHF